MNITFISIFPEIFESFVTTSLVKKAIESGHITTAVVDPRIFCDDKHQQIDDDPYGGGAGLVMKAPPIIAAIKNTIKEQSGNTAIIMVQPSQQLFVQQSAHDFADRYDTIIFVTGRYEGIDHRVCLWGREEFGADWYELSLGEFITLGGETPAMVMTEAIVRLLPGVIKEQASWENESYRPDVGGKKIEHPQYTRPQVVEGFDVPEVLLSGNHAEIEKWRDGNMTQ